MATKEINYREQHAVIVRVANEREQEETFNRLKSLGYKNLKIVSV